MAFSPSIDYFGIFGDGSDLDATWTSASPVTLTVDREYNNLTITSGDHYTDGFMIRVRGTLTLNGGRLLDEGNPGTDGQTVSDSTNLITKSSGGAGDTGTGWLRRVKYAGGSGGSAKNTVDSDSNGSGGSGTSADGNYPPTRYIVNYGGGAGGDSFSAGVYGKGGSTGSPGLPVATINSLFLAAIARQRNTNDTENFCSLGCGAGGAGGAGYPRTASTGGTKGSGGGGGGGGGLIWIAARKIVVNGSFEISVKGGDGGDGQNAIAPVGAVTYPGAGGGGGGGGTIVVIAEQAVDWNVAGGKPTLNVNGGTGGSGTPAGINIGSDGEAGESYVYILS